LTAALDRHVASFDAAGRAWAERVALQVARHCDQLRATSTIAVLERCDRVLEYLATAPPAASAEPVSGVAKPLVPTRNARAEAQELAASHGGSNDPVVVERAPHAERRAAAMPPLPIQSTPQAALGNVRVVDAAPLEPSSTPPIAPESVAPAPLAPRDDLAPAPKPRPLGPSSSDPSLVDVPGPHEIRRWLRRYRGMSNDELAAELRTAGGHQALMIDEVLQERDAPRRRTREADAAVGSPPDIRQQLLDRVSTLPPARARQLLRELASDDAQDAETRLHALSLLATSGDPKLAEIARSRAIKDADARVADLAMKILSGQITK
jgi:hypothetical protein